MPIPRKRSRRDVEFVVASDDAAQLAEEAVGLIERAVGVPWYDFVGNDADRAAVALCRLRRTRAAVRAGPGHGDAAVRDALGRVSPEAVTWIASRAISYLDENAFPELVEPYLDHVD